MPKYTVVAGKHHVRNKDGSETAVPQGGTVEMTEEQAAKFPGKFALAAVVEEPKPVQPQRPGQQQQKPPVDQQ